LQNLAASGCIPIFVGSAVEPIHINHSLIVLWGIVVVFFAGFTIQLISIQPIFWLDEFPNI
jgi:hypothetical protein